MLVYSATYRATLHPLYGPHAHLFPGAPTAGTATAFRLNGGRWPEAAGGFCWATTTLHVSPKSRPRRLPSQQPRSRRWLWSGAVDLNRLRDLRPSAFSYRHGAACSWANSSWSGEGRLSASPVRAALAPSKASGGGQGSGPAPGLCLPARGVPRGSCLRNSSLVDASRTSSSRQRSTNPPSLQVCNGGGQGFKLKSCEMPQTQSPFSADPAVPSLSSLRRRWGVNGDPAAGAKMKQDLRFPSPGFPRTPVGFPGNAEKSDPWPLATEVASVLRGKNKPAFTPHLRTLVIS